jgi:hypothetical protein
MDAPENTNGVARLLDIRRELEHGGIVRLRWGLGGAILIHADGAWFTPIDGRTYHGFLRTDAPNLQRTETGSKGTKDFVIEWKRK